MFNLLSVGQDTRCFGRDLGEKLAADAWASADRLLLCLGNLVSLVSVVWSLEGVVSNLPTLQQPDSRPTFFAPQPKLWMKLLPYWDMPHIAGPELVHLQHVPFVPNNWKPKVMPCPGLVLL